ncbi:hypothetical protein BC826DRAFT_445273 [Russula brevipes]|nr:hypothetical protein BC826DRAFT_445273 [Russula brevipes]
MRLRPRRLSRWHLVTKVLDTTVLYQKSTVSPSTPARLHQPQARPQLPVDGDSTGMSRARSCCSTRRWGLTYPCIDAATAHRARMLVARNLHLLSLSLKAKTRHRKQIERHSLPCSLGRGARGAIERPEPQLDLRPRQDCIAPGSMWVCVLHLGS